jgi:RNA recognition motif-containing protein
VSINGETDRSLGFGLVELADHGMAHEAVQRLNGSTWNGRTLIVSGGALSKDDK